MLAVMLCGFQHFVRKISTNDKVFSPSILVLYHILCDSTKKYCLV